MLHRKKIFVRSYFPKEAHYSNWRELALHYFVKDIAKIVWIKLTFFKRRVSYYDIYINLNNCLGHTLIT